MNITWNVIFPEDGSPRYRMKAVIGEVTVNIYVSDNVRLVVYGKDKDKQIANRIMDSVEDAQDEGIAVAKEYLEKGN